MLAHQYGKAHSSPSGFDRFIASVSGTLLDLQVLLLETQRPIEAGTGAQIAQMLRAIREAASTFELDRVARTAADTERYLLSSEAYGAGGFLRNFDLSTKIELLSRQLEEAVPSDRGASGRH